MKPDQDEAPAEREQREQLQRLALGLARMVKHQLAGAECGFALVLFDSGAKGSMAYAADGLRTDVATMFREVAGKISVETEAASIVSKRGAS
jgi:hypothetical protein